MTNWKGSFSWENLSKNNSVCKTLWCNYIENFSLPVSHWYRAVEQNSFGPFSQIRTKGFEQILA